MYDLFVNGEITFFLLAVEEKTWEHNIFLSTKSAVKIKMGKQFTLQIHKMHP